MAKYYYKKGNLKDSVPIDKEYHLLSQLAITDVKKGEVVLVAAEIQAINEGLKKGDFAFFVTLEIRATTAPNPDFNKTDSADDFEITGNRGDNIVSRKDHYGIDTRVGGYEAKKDYPVLYFNLWAKSGSTQASKGDKCFFKENTMLIVFRF